MLIEKIKKHLLIIWTAFVLILTLMPTPEYNGDKEMYYDKVAHVFLFGIFAYLFYRSFELKTWKRIIFSIIAGIGFSLLIEFLQLFVPGRDASEMDLVAGVVGVLGFVFVAYKQKK